MQRLNLRTPKPYDYSDEAETVNPRARFFCVSEGPTEESYFEGVKNSKKALGIKNDVFIEIVPKEEGQENYSHPKQLVYACLSAMGRIDVDGNELPKHKWEESCRWDYDPVIDSVCVIFDRDYRRLDEHMQELFYLCKKHHIDIVMSNPNFELWLLMHYGNIEQYDKALLLKNPKNLRGELFSDASIHKKYLEILLSKVSDGYTKGCKLRFERFLPRIPIAMEQAGLFSEQSEELLTKSGSVVGQLIKRMQE